MKKLLTKLFILFSLLLTATSNIGPVSLDIIDTTTDIEVFSNIPLDDNVLE